LIGVEEAMMLLLQATAHAATAAHAAAAAAQEGAGQAAEHEGSSFHTGSLLHPLYKMGLLDAAIIPEEVAVSLVMMLLIGLACFLLTRRLSVQRPSKVQAALELAVSSLQNMATGMIGPQGPRHLPLVGTLFLYILFMNLAGIFPLWKSPTSNLVVTGSLALVAIVYVHFHAIRANGLAGYLRHYVGEPAWMAPLNFPLHIMGELARPISLCFRLFGNIFGEDTVVAILIMLGAGFLVPVHFPMLFLVIFTSFVQAMVFTMLTCVYLSGFLTHGEDHGHEEEHGVVHGAVPAPPA
jgi:F-type H+-transporting ATPase subunit a